MAYQHWSTEQILNLIEVYRSHECLWRSSSDDYGDREKKDHAWDVIAKCVGADVRSAERKIKTLKTQFANYHKLALKKANERGDGFKKPKWFAYGALEFLLEGRAPRNTESVLKSEGMVRLSREDCDAPVIPAGAAWEPAPLQHEMDCTDADHDSEIMETGYCTPVDPAVLKTEFNSQFGNLLKDVLNFAKSVQQSNTRDECSIFGEHIACRLRKIRDARTRLLAQDRIHSVLFNLEVEEHSGIYATEGQMPRKKQLNSLHHLNVNKDTERTQQRCADTVDELQVTPAAKSSCAEVDSTNSAQLAPEIAAEHQSSTKKLRVLNRAQETPPDASAERALEAL